MRAAMAEAGLADDVEMREIRTDDEAEAAAFTGSPTILIGGVELMTSLNRGAGDEPAGLNCRVYVRRDGRVSPTPDPQDLRDALNALHDRED
ncbi:MAG: thioredoxin family protein [Solirubrobacteraceae bacterium]